MTKWFAVLLLAISSTLPSALVAQSNLPTGSLNPGDAYPEDAFQGKQINGNIQGGARVIQLGARLQF